MSQPRQMDLARAPGRPRLHIPREHGAWAMLLGPLAIGAGAAGGLGGEILLFLGACLFVFMARPPFLRLLRAPPPNQTRRLGGEALWSGGYGLLAILFGLALLLNYGRWWLLPLALLGLSLLGLQLYLERRKLHRTAPAQLLAVAGLTLSAPGAHYVAQGVMSVELAGLWLIAFLYWGSSVFYVKARVSLRARRGRNLGLSQRWQLGSNAVLYLAVCLALVGLAAMAGLLPALMPLAFLPLAYKTLSGLFLAPLEVSIRRLGFTELGHSVAFVLLAILAYHSPWG